MKRVMVDMSVSLLHHGHVRLLQKAKELGQVIVALTTDEEILKHKGYHGELSFDARKEMLLALSCVDEVVPSPWHLDNEFLRKHNADCLVHSGPNFNDVDSLVSFERTVGISSSDMRESATRSIVESRNSERCLLTPGPTNLHAQSLIDLAPVFTRSDPVYTKIEQRVFANILKLAGQDTIAAMQGSATTAIEVATTNFITGGAVVITSGYYSRRLLEMLERKKDRLGLTSVRGVSYDQFLADPDLSGVNWVLCAYTETADAFLADLEKIAAICQRHGARVMVDATGSINLESGHEVADVLMFSSCKGLGGLAGAGFITFKNSLLNDLNACPKEFILDLATYLEKKTTAPVHAISSLFSISDRFEELGKRVRSSKKVFVEMFGRYLARPGNQPALCTKLANVTMQAPDYMLTYSPRTAEPGSAVVCHLFDQFDSNRECGQAYRDLKISGV